MTIEIRFPSGASVEQVKKDAKKLRRTAGVTLSEAQDLAAKNHGIELPWAQALASLAKRKSTAFELPLADGTVRAALFTPEKPIAILTAPTTDRQLIIALLLAELQLKKSKASVHYLNHSIPIRMCSFHAPGESCGSCLLDDLQAEYPGRVHVTLGANVRDLVKLKPAEGDVVILRQEFCDEIGLDIEAVADIAHTWKAPVLICSPGQLVKPGELEQGVGPVVMSVLAHHSGQFSEPHFTSDIHTVTLTCGSRLEITAGVHLDEQRGVEAEPSYRIRLNTPILAIETTDADAVAG